MRAILQIAGQEDAKLTRRKIGAIAPDERHDGIAQYADLLVGSGWSRHVTIFLSSPGSLCPIVNAPNRVAHVAATHLCLKVP
jgi:hypothetical protein